MSSIKKTEELKGTDLKLNKGNVTEGVFFACVVVLFTSQREYFNKDKVTDIKDIEANQVKDYIKKNISPKCKEIFSKDTINSIQFIYNFNEIVTNHNKNFSDTVFGTLALNLVDAQHFIDIDNNNVKHIFDEIIKDCLKTVNKSQLKKFSRDVYINDFNDKILIEAKGPIDASTGVKEDITITINNKPYKISLKNGNNVLGQFGISSKSGSAIFEKIQSFFTTYFNFNFPNGLKMKFDKLVVNSNSLSEMSHEVMKEAKNILVKSKVEKQKEMILNAFSIAMGNKAVKNNNIVVFDIGHNIIKNIDTYKTIVNSCKAFGFETSLSAKQNGKEFAHGQLDCYGLKSSLNVNSNTKIHMFKIRFKITNSEKRMYFENGSYSNSNVKNINAFIN